MPDMLALLRDTGCLFVTSAVESVDDEVLAEAAEGAHPRRLHRAPVAACRQAGVTLVAHVRAVHAVDDRRRLSSTCSNEIESLDLAEAVAPIQLAIRLLVTAESKLLELPEVRDLVDPFDAQSLTFPWRHPDPRVDELQRTVMQLVAGASGGPGARCSTASGPRHPGTGARRPRESGPALALHDRGMVLLRGARARTTRSACETRTALCHDNRISNPIVRRGCREAGCAPHVRERPLRSARGPLVGCCDPGQVSREVAICRGCGRGLSWAARRRESLAVGDRPTVLAAYVSAALGLPGNPPWAAEASRNKQATRRAFAAAGLPTPDFQVLSLSDPCSRPLRVVYPVVVKPLALSGSRGRDSRR